MEKKQSRQSCFLYDGFNAYFLFYALLLKGFRQYIIVLYKNQLHNQEGCIL